MPVPVDQPVKLVKVKLEEEWLKIVGNELQDFRLVIENNVVIMPKLNTDMHCGFSAYTGYSASNIPQVLKILLFLERVVYDLHSSQHLPSNVVTTTDSVSKVCV